jgi:hypothetical protein
VHFLLRKSILSLLLAFGLSTIIGITSYQSSYATICFDCPGKNATFHLDEAKKSIDNGDYTGAKTHIDQAKQIIGQMSSSNQTGRSINNNNPNSNK